MMDWIAFLHIFTLANKILLFPLFFFRKNNSLANRMLALLILLPAFPVASNYIFYTGWPSDFVNPLFFSQVLFSLFGPLYFFYCMEMMGRPFRFNKIKLLHLLPALSVLACWIVYLCSDTEAQRRFAAGFITDGSTTWQMVLASAVPILTVMAYILISAWVVFKNIAAFKEVFTNLENLKSGYIREFILVMLAEIVLLAIIYAITPIWYVDLVWVPILSNVMYFYIVYKSYNYGVIFTGKGYDAFQKLYVPLKQHMKNNAQKKYYGSTLSVLKVDEYAQQLADGFATQKWHLDPELNLSILSAKSGIPSHYISQVINQKFEKNFFDFVNSHRVGELKIKLTDTALNHIKLEELAYMCGFNSKAAYQRAFKKHTGMTPTDYRNSRQGLSLKVG